MIKQGRYRREAAEIEDEIVETRARLDDSLERLFDRLSPVSLLDQAIGRAQDSGFALAERVGHLFWRRPVPAALVSVGMSLFRSRAKLRDKYRETASRGSARLSNAARRARRRVHDLEDNMQETTRRGREKFREVGDKLRERVRGRDKAESYEDENEAFETAAPAKTGGEYAARTKEKLHRAVDTARVRARDYGTRARTQADDFFAREPLVTGAVLLAAGAALAAILPSSRSERKTLARPAQRLRKDATRVLSDSVEKGTNAATAALESARETIESEGFGMDQNQERPAVH